MRSMANPVSRRSFLAAGAAAFPAAGLLRVTPRATASPAAKKILIIGGTGHLGPAEVEAARVRGHELTLFNRGRTDKDLFPDLAWIEGDRRKPEDVAKLKDGKWDAVIDNVGYFPRDVKLVADALAGRVEQYVFVSSVSVYPKFGFNTDTVDEATPVGELKDPAATRITEENYGPLKAACEAEAEKVFPGQCTQVRPGYIVGPRDRSDRFTYWPMRVARGGEVLAPGDPTCEFQVIDVRDLGAWIVHAVETKATGAFNTVGYAGSYTIQEVLHGAKCVLDDTATFTWVDDAFLKDNKVTSWGDLPWTPRAEYGHIDIKRSLAAGMTFRPIAETIRDTHAWAKTRPADYKARAGMAAERERELLAKWKAR